MASPLGSRPRPIGPAKAWATRRNSAAASPWVGSAASAATAPPPRPFQVVRAGISEAIVLARDEVAHRVGDQNLPAVVGAGVLDGGRVHRGGRIADQARLTALRNNRPPHNHVETEARCVRVRPPRLSYGGWPCPTGAGTWWQRR